MREGATIGEDVAALMEWKTGHEKICGERYRLLLAVVSIGMTIILGVASMGMLSIYNNIQNEAQATRAMVQEKH